MLCYCRAPKHMVRFAHFYFTINRIQTMFWEVDKVSKSYSVFVTESNKLSLTSSHLVVLPVLFFSAVN